jgi:hypothetical protein
MRMCQVRGIDVGVTKPQLAQALLDWVSRRGIAMPYLRLLMNPQHMAQTRTASKSNASSHATTKGKRSRRSRNSPSTEHVIHAIASHTHVSGRTTPVLLRDHMHANDPDTPRSGVTTKQASSKTGNGEGELDLDLWELGLENSVITADQLVKLEKIGSGGFKE